MPTYEYLCDRCNKSYELQESFSADSRHTCHKCGKGTAKRVLHAPRVLYKGSGFYVTDSKKSSSSYSESSSTSTSLSESSADSGGDSDSSDTTASGGGGSTNTVESEAAG